MDFKKLSEMTHEEVNNLPVLDCRISKSLIRDKKSNKVTGTRYTCAASISKLLVIRETITQAQFGLIALSQDRNEAYEFDLKARAYFTKGVKQNGDSYYLVELQLSQDVAVQHIFMWDEVKLLNSLVKKNIVSVKFISRPENEVPNARQDEEIEITL